MTLAEYDDVLATAYRDQMRSLNESIMRDMLGPWRHPSNYRPEPRPLHKQVADRLRWWRQDQLRRAIWNPLKDFAVKHGADYDY